MNKQYKCLFLHILWTVSFVLICGVKFVWYYDWSSTEDWLATLMVAGLSLLELVMFLKRKETRKLLAGVSKSLLIYDVFLCAFLVLFPFLLGNPTVNYIAWNIIIPSILLCAAALIRSRFLAKK